MLIKKITSPFVEFGFAAGLLYAANRVLESISSRMGLHVYEYMVQPITEKGLLPAGLAKGLTFREIREGDPEVALMPAREDIKRLRFEQGAHCLGAYSKGDLIGYMWYCPVSYEEDEVRCRYVLPEDGRCVFDFDIYVMPERRMGIAFLGVWHGANEFLWKSGVRHSFSRLNRFNLASRRAHKHLNWRKVGSAVILRVGRAEIMFTSLAPYLAASFGRAGRPSLKLSAGDEGEPKPEPNAGARAPQ